MEAKGRGKEEGKKEEKKEYWRIKRDEDKGEWKIEKPKLMKSNSREIIESGKWDNKMREIERKIESEKSDRKERERETRTDVLHKKYQKKIIVKNFKKCLNLELNLKLNKYSIKK